jgi:hypothetical protein
MQQIELMKYIPQGKTAPATAPKRRRKTKTICRAAHGQLQHIPTAHDVDAEQCPEAVELEQVEATEQARFWAIADELIHDWRYEC